MCNECGVCYAEVYHIVSFLGVKEQIQLALDARNVLQSDHSLVS